MRRPAIINYYSLFRKLARTTSDGAADPKLMAANIVGSIYSEWYWPWGLNEEFIGYTIHADEVLLSECVRQANEQVEALNTIPSLSPRITVRLAASPELENIRVTFSTAE